MASVRTRESTRGPRAAATEGTCAQTRTVASLLTRSLPCWCLLNQRKQTINLLNAASFSLFGFPTSTMWIFLFSPCLLTHMFLEGSFSLLSTSYFNWNLYTLSFLLIAWFCSFMP